MSCPFYYWNHDFSCRKTGKEVSSDIYYRYCRDYSYDECPIYKDEDYKAEDQSSGCFLTTACVKAKKLPDDCEQLNILRTFRDTYLNESEEGRNDIKMYYFIAPQIVDAINSNENAIEMWNCIYEKVIMPCVLYIKEGNNEEAYKLYKSCILHLSDMYSTI